MKQRFWEVDTLRGIAIVMMVIYHFLWNLYFFGLVSFDTLISPFWKYFQRSIACNFITLVGIALVISHIAATQSTGAKSTSAKPARAKRPANQGKQAETKSMPWWRKIIPYGWLLIVASALFIAILGTDPLAKLQRVIAVLYLIMLSVAWLVDWFTRTDLKVEKPAGLARTLWRALWVFGWGMVVSTSVALGGTGSVDFGVLHLIGFSILASYPLMNFRWINVGLWLLFNAVGYYLIPARASDIWFVWLGWRPEGYGAVDYFPIFPWFGVVLLGIAIGNFVYSREGRRFALPDLGAWFPMNLLQWLGKRSLFIYLIHQPIMFSLLTVLNGLGLLARG